MSAAHVPLAEFERVVGERDTAYKRATLAEGRLITSGEKVSEAHALVRQLWYQLQHAPIPEDAELALRVETFLG